MYPCFALADVCGGIDCCRYTLVLVWLVLVVVYIVVGTPLYFVGVAVVSGIDGCRYTLVLVWLMLVIC